jgi:hypothetical protein
MIKLYDRIKYLLETAPIYRNSDDELQWQIWVDTGTVVCGVITKNKFLTALNPETIRRTRQKVQEDNPHLKADKNVLEMREKKEKTGGYFPYHEEVKVPLEEMQKQLEQLVEKWRGKVPPKGNPEYYKFRADRSKAIKLRLDIQAKQAEVIFAS